MVVETGNVGKSWLFRRCFLDELVSRDGARSSTHDIDLVRRESPRWVPSIIVGDKRRDIELRVWDFAGQLVTHSVHEGFLDDDGRTIYLLVLSATRTPSSHLDEKGDEAGNAVAYWLKPHPRPRRHITRLV